MAKTFHVDLRPGIILRWVVLLFFIAVGFAYVEWSSRSRFDAALEEATTITKETRKNITEFISEFRPLKQVDINSQHLDRLEDDFRVFCKSIQTLTSTVESLRSDIAKMESAALDE